MYGVALMPTEHLIRWYYDQPGGLDASFEYSPDGNNWTPIEAYGRTYHRECYEATVTADNGYIRMPGIAAKPGLSADGHDIQVLPEPAGLVWGLLALLALRRLRGGG